MPPRVESHPVLGDLPKARVVEITLDGRPLPAREGEPVAMALLAAGKRVLRRSEKLGEPRGIFCALGRCTDCAMTVDGQPNVRTCITPVREGMQVQTRPGARPQARRPARPEQPVARVPAPHGEAEVAVVGSGPAGLCAALEAARAGAKVVLLDENDRPGGQLIKQIHRFFGTTSHHAGRRGYEIGQELLAEVRALGVDVRLSTAVWAAFPGPVLGCAPADGPAYHLRAQRVVLATGASERALAFPGWTLPGVMGAGAAQTLVNLHRVLPGRRALIVGAGNVGLIVAFQLLQAGAEVAAAVEAAPQIGGWAVHANRLRREGVPILTSHTILAVEGREGVTSAVIGQLDGTGRPLVGSERRLRVDLVCLAVGLRPQTQLAGMLDLAMVDDPCRGGGVPWRDGALRSSDAHVYVVGDLGAVAEASIAMEEGRIAGLAAATSLGHGSPTDADRRIAEARERIAVLAAPIARGPGLAKQPGGHLGPIIECPERIPCDPCEAACPTGAIRVGPDPTAVPSVDAGRCDGCLRCVRACPGMAIFVRRAGPDPGEVMLALPWEFLPLPQTGDLGHGLDREGRRVCEVRVVGVRPFRKRGGTAVVQIAVPSRHARRVRGYARRSSR